MAQLQIQIYGPAMDLYIGLVQRDDFRSLQKACSYMGLIYNKKKLSTTWYNRPDLMKSIFGVDDWRQIVSGGHHYYGPLLTDRKQLNAFCDMVDITLDEQEIAFQPAQLRTRFKAARQAPALTQSNIAVCHGEYYTGYTTYTTSLQAPLQLEQLRLVFADGGENGHFLTHIEYGRHKIMPHDSEPAKEQLALQLLTL
jgi:hypothetical protein